MESMRLVRILPLAAVLIAALAASAVGCGGKGGDRNEGGTGGTGGDVVGTGGAGGSGGDGGSGGSGGSDIITCAEDEDCQVWERCDKETETCVPRCMRDADCGRNKGLRCDTENGGVCVPGEPCNITANCGAGRNFKYCDQKDNKCICVEDDAMKAGTPPAAGVCWRLAKTCDLCDSDEECGASGSCTEYDYDGETRRVCLKKIQGGGICPGGMDPAPADSPYAGLCVPQFGDCATFRPCSSDADCDSSRPVCDLQSRRCIHGCTFDYDGNKSLGCAAERVCHNTKEGTNPKVLDDCATAHLWGIGKCAPPCESDNECNTYGQGWVCRSYGKEKRCAPFGANEGKCLSDNECTLPSPDDVTGYCDVSANECVQDGCRLGFDKRKGCGTDKPYPDCTERFKCVTDPGTNDRIKGMCVEKDCLDLGGANVGGCVIGHFCANEPYRDMFTGELIEKYTEPPQGISPGECFPMEPLGEWCKPCGDDNDCGNPPTGIKDIKSFCHVVDPMSGMQLCAPACRHQQDCPAGWTCSSRQHELLCDKMDGNFNPFANFFRTCMDDENCPGNTKCVDPIVGGSTFRFTKDMVDFKVCACDPEEANACGAGYACNAGLATAGNKDKVIKANYCVQTDRNACGAGGSCEWTGSMAANPDRPQGSPLEPVFKCLTDAGDFKGLTVTCPAGFHGGLQQSAKYNCVEGQVCEPRLVQGECRVP